MDDHMTTSEQLEQMLNSTERHVSFAVSREFDDYMMLYDEIEKFRRDGIDVYLIRPQGLKKLEGYKDGTG